MDKFSITAKTCTLKYNSQEQGSTVINKDVKYVIPIYQRPYSWTEKEIKKLISDIFNSFWGSDENVKTIVEEPMFIGTMQLSAIKNNNDQDIIDGQQRVTTLLLLLKVLKFKYSNCKELNELNFNILRTEVNSGEQQKNLKSAIEFNFHEEINNQNKYLENLNIIDVTIKSIISEYEDDFDIEKFVKYLLSNVYFVVIETNAGLSKTLQIFNAINTTGLDLNGGDLFKIRMYEYLTNKKQEDKSVFDDISNLYQKIDQKNIEIGWNADIRIILSIYQYIIIAKYKLPTTLYYLGVDTFFDRLFDTLLNINTWEHFRNNVKDVELSLTDIEKIIEVRYEWEEKWRKKVGFSAEDICAIHLIWWSRYSRYWNLIFVFLFVNKDKEDSWDNMLYFVKQINKLFFIFSVRFQKIKNEIYYGLMHRIIDAIVKNSFEEMMIIINESIGNNEMHNMGWYDLNWFLSENLTENTKRKNLICRLSALLDEEYTTNDSEKVKAIERNLFYGSIDIEHIQSYLDKNKEKREDILKEWGNNINSIGNLMILEQDINRSISNNDYKEKTSNERKLSYLISKFKIVQNQVTFYKEWNLEKCKERKENEKQKLISYLFSNV